MSDNVIISLIGGVFLIANTCITLILTNRLKEYRKEVNGMKKELVEAVKGKGEQNQVKNIDVYKVAFLILVSVFSYIIIIVITGMVMSKIPTTADNKEIREQILEMVSGIQSSITLILGYKLGKAANENK